MKKKQFLLSLGILALFCGCATTEDLNRARRELDQRITVADEKAEAQRAAIHQDLEKVTGAVTAFRKSQADAGADVTDIRSNIQQLRGITDGLRKDISAAAARSARGDEEVKGLKEKLDNVLFKISFIEDFLGIGKKEEPGEGNGKQAAGGLSGKENGKGTNKEAMYAAAYELFKDRKYDRARTEFQNFLKQFPDTEYSDNAQFWIGECYYFEKKYENAILEYEKVVKNYSEGDKVAHALLKEGFSFFGLGDKASAKLVLQRVIKDYPNTNQARTAKAKLLSIK
ncbi:MAG: tol-pal system protein YbgF [Deltaproteobacteria bacterium]|nr:tol-pal system protein YbgF [Deltaproteobacteria bacterium]